MFLAQLLSQRILSNVFGARAWSLPRGSKMASGESREVVTVEQPKNGDYGGTLDWPWDNPQSQSDVDTKDTRALTSARVRLRSLQQRDKIAQTCGLSVAGELVTNYADTDFLVQAPAGRMHLSGSGTVADDEGGIHVWDRKTAGVPDPDGGMGPLLGTPGSALYHVHVSGRGMRVLETPSNSLFNPNGFAPAADEVARAYVVYSVTTNDLQEETRTLAIQSTNEVSIAGQQDVVVRAGASSLTLKAETGQLFLGPNEITPTGGALGFLKADGSVQVAAPLLPESALVDLGSASSRYRAVYSGSLAGPGSSQNPLQVGSWTQGIGGDSVSINGSTVTINADNIVFGSPITNYTWFNTGSTIITQGTQVTLDRTLLLNNHGVAGTAVGSGLEIQETGAVYSSWVLGANGWLATRGTYQTLLPFGSAAGLVRTLLSDGSVSLSGSLLPSGTGVPLGSNAYPFDSVSAKTLMGPNTLTVRSDTSGGVLDLGDRSGSKPSTINIGFAGDTVNIGAPGGHVYILGKTAQVETVRVSQKTFQLNAGGLAESAGGSGIEFMEADVATGYIRITNDRENFEFKSPKYGGTVIMYPPDNIEEDYVITAKGSQGFLVSPSVPAPTNSGHAVNKGYTDDTFLAKTDAVATYMRRDGTQPFTARPRVTGVAEYGLDANQLNTLITWGDGLKLAFDFAGIDFNFLMFKTGGAFTGVVTGVDGTTSDAFVTRGAVDSLTTTKMPLAGGAFTGVVTGVDGTSGSALVTRDGVGSYLDSHFASIGTSYAPTGARGTQYVAIVDPAALSVVSSVGATQSGQVTLHLGGWTDLNPVVTLGGVTYTYISTLAYQTTATVTIQPQQVYGRSFALTTPNLASYYFVSGGTYTTLTQQQFDSVIRGNMNDTLNSITIGVNSNLGSIVLLGNGNLLDLIVDPVKSALKYMEVNWAMTGSADKAGLRVKVGSEVAGDPNAGFFAPTGVDIAASSSAQEVNVGTGTGSTTVTIGELGGSDVMTVNAATTVNAQTLLRGNTSFRGVLGCESALSTTSAVAYEDFSICDPEVFKITTVGGGVQSGTVTLPYTRIPSDKKNYMNNTTYTYAYEWDVSTSVDFSPPFPLTPSITLVVNSMSLYVFRKWTGAAWTYSALTLDKIVSAPQESMFELYFDLVADPLCSIFYYTNSASDPLATLTINWTASKTWGRPTDSQVSIAGSSQNQKVNIGTGTGTTMVVIGESASDSLHVNATTSFTKAVSGTMTGATGSSLATRDWVVQSIGQLTISYSASSSSFTRGPYTSYVPITSSGGSGWVYWTNQVFTVNYTSLPSNTTNITATIASYTNQGRPEFSISVISATASTVTFQFTGNWNAQYPSDSELLKVTYNISANAPSNNYTLSIAATTPSLSQVGVYFENGSAFGYKRYVISRLYTQSLQIATAETIGDWTNIQITFDVNAVRFTLISLFTTGTTKTCAIGDTKTMTLNNL